jgi:hypothetical protein
MVPKELYRADTPLYGYEPCGTIDLLSELIVIQKDSVDTMRVGDLVGYE